MPNNEEKGFASAHINWDIRIFRKIGSKYWKYWIFNVEIFTYLINLEK